MKNVFEVDIWHIRIKAFNAIAITLPIVHDTQRLILLLEPFYFKRKTYIRQCL